MTSDPIDPEDGHDPEVSKGEAPQAMRLFNDETEPDVHLDPNLAAFDRVQDDKRIDADIERESNRRYAKEHGDHRAENPGTEPPLDDR